MLRQEAMHVETTAGFVLCGGQSRRMGQDKALLPYAGSTLVEHMARLLQSTAGSATLVGAPERYRHLGYAVLADPVDDSGPLAGLVALLQHTQADLNVVAACDMPGLDAGFVLSLLEAARKAPEADAILPTTTRGRHPLGAVYRRQAYHPLAQALSAGQRKVTEAIKQLKIQEIPVSAERMANLNTPEEWLRFVNA